MSDLPSDLKCPRCKSMEIAVQREWFVFCLDCGAMPNANGYSTLFNAVRAFRKWMARPWSQEAEEAYRSEP